MVLSGVIEVRLTAPCCNIGFPAIGPAIFGCCWPEGACGDEAIWLCWCWWGSDIGLPKVLCCIDCGIDCCMPCWERLGGCAMPGIIEGPEAVRA